MGIINNLTVDIVFKNNKWHDIKKKLDPFLSKDALPNFAIFKLCVATGIMYDKQTEIINDSDYTFTVPRTVMQNYISDLDFLFQSAIVSTKLTNYTIEERLDLAFNEECNIEFDKIEFLKKFAAFGIDKLLEVLNSVRTSDTTELMDKINKFVESAKNNVML